MNSKILIDLIVGARPNFMKVAPIIHALVEHRAEGGLLRFRLVHTGQHYDTQMSGDFFKQLNIPKPEVNLSVGSGGHAEQTGAIMVRYEALLKEQPSHLCLVVGDVTSTMACAITAQKQHIPVAHVEGGIRSDDWSMPEEINRLVTDSISNWFFTTSRTANKNLQNAGITNDRIFFVGNTMIDTLLANLPHLRPPDFWDSLKLSDKSYFVLTLHRPSNVDDMQGFMELLIAVSKSVRGRRVIFPVHPRTAKTLSVMSKIPDNIILVDPQPYLEFNYLLKHSMGVITDSGGITEEATVFGVPCMTLRENTERPETVTIGTNELIGSDHKKLAIAMDQLFDSGWKNGSIPEKWDGKAAKRIVAAIDRIFK